MYQVRNGQRVVPTCPKCGCRLQYSRYFLYVFEHFKHPALAKVDGQSHSCEYLNVPLTLVNKELISIT